MPENSACAFEFEPCGNDFFLHNRRIDAVESFSYICGRARGGDMIQHDVDAAGLEGREHSFVKCSEVLSRCPIVKVVVVLRCPREIKRLRCIETVDRTLNDADIRIAWIGGQCLDAVGCGGAFCEQLLRNECVHMPF